MSTPANHWRNNGEPDPFGDSYDIEFEDLMGAANYPTKTLSRLMTPEFCSSIMGIEYTTVAKNRLRWLSRRLYKIVGDPEEICIARSKLPSGDLTDDELANAFFMSETKELLDAGKARILWLHDEISKAEMPA